MCRGGHPDFDPSGPSWSSFIRTPWYRSGPSEDDRVVSVITGEGESFHKGNLDLEPITPEWKVNLFVVRPSSRDRTVQGSDDWGEVYVFIAIPVDTYEGRVAGGAHDVESHSGHL